MRAPDHNPLEPIWLGDLRVLLRPTHNGKNVSVWLFAPGIECHFQLDAAHTRSLGDLFKIAACQAEAIERRGEKPHGNVIALSVPEPELMFLKKQAD